MEGQAVWLQSEPCVRTSCCTMLWHSEACTDHMSNVSADTTSVVTTTACTVSQRLLQSKSGNPPLPHTHGQHHRCDRSATPTPRSTAPHSHHQSIPSPVGKTLTEGLVHSSEHVSAAVTATLPSPSPPAQQGRVHAHRGGPLAGDTFPKLLEGCRAGTMVSEQGVHC